MPRLALFLFVSLVSFVVPARAAEPARNASHRDVSGPFLKPNDVIALVGGEDMVAAAEYGYLELLLQRALPEHRLKVRSLAWEGDTVFEQPRDLNYPTLEAQLDEVGATVVIMQFGQMESLAGTSKLPEFIKAYRNLVERVEAGGKRRVVPMIPSLQGDAATSYVWAIRDVRPKAISGSDPNDIVLQTIRGGPEGTRDGVHLTEPAHAFGSVPTVAPLLGLDLMDKIEDSWGQPDDPVLRAIRAKNRLWFHYYRPQNWAFLAGDRTEQPSSRDHKDPSKRWFPEEMKQWLPLIDAKEKEIWALAAKSAKP